MKKLLLFIIGLFLPFSLVSALELNFNSENVILYNYDTDEVIYEKDADEVISIASMTKIMTALVIIENIDDLDKTVVLTQKHFAGLKEAYASLAGFRLGQKVTYRDLLHGILIPSGAEAVQTLAIEVFGSNNTLVEKMNDRTKELGLNNTHFINPFGLDAEGHYSTVREVSIFLKEALKNKTFKEIYTTRKYLVSDKSITFYSTIVEPLNMINKNADYIKGSKTGFTGAAGRCLSSIAYDEVNDIFYLMVTARAKERVEPIIDAVNTYEYLFDNYSNHVIVEKDEIVKQVKTKYAKQKEANIKVSEEVSLFLENSSYDASKITLNYNIPDKIKRTLKKDSKVGTLTVLYDGKEIKTVDLLVDQDIDISMFRLFLNTILPIGALAFICILIFKKR